MPFATRKLLSSAMNAKSAIISSTHTRLMVYMIPWHQSTISITENGTAIAIVSTYPSVMMYPRGCVIASTS